MARIHLEENVYATVTSEGTLIIENVTEGPLGQDRIRCIGLSPTGAQALLDLLANGEAVEQPRALDGWRCPECDVVNADDVPVCECGYSKSRRK